jgi:hypothetical protein
VFGGVLLALGLAILATSWIGGAQTGWFVWHVTFPAGFWLAADGLSEWLGERPLARRGFWHIVALVAAGTWLGLLLDTIMVQVTGILDYVAVRDIPTALLLYVGWGFCLPAIVASYRATWAGLRRLPIPTAPALPAAWCASLIRWAGPAGAALLASALFLRLYYPTRLGFMVAPAFLGLWLLMESLGERLDLGPGLLDDLLAGRWASLLAMVPPALLLALTWEGLNNVMGSWAYGNLFLLEPAILGVPLVAYSGYICWYALFLSFHRVVSRQAES